MSDKEPPEEAPDDLYRPEDFKDVRYRPLTRQQQDNRRLLISAIVSVLVIGLAFCTEHLRA